MAKYDVGVIGVWYGCNYGSIATYYALNTLLKSMGKSVLMIDKPLTGADDAELGKTHSRRFALEHYDISKNYTISDFPILNEFCDAFVIGSDQLWNYGISKGTGKTFYLDFAEAEKKKIAYATSYGHAVDFAPPEERKKIARYMARFDGIGLREDDGVTITKRDYGINAIQVLDPVFSVKPSIYNKLIKKSKHKETEPYLATYILDPTPEKTAAIQHVAKELGGLKIINLLDGLMDKFEQNKAAMGLPNCIENLQVEDWLYYLSHASFVITDSCHGASFAMIFQKNFIAICNKSRGFSRFQSLGRMFHIFDHIVTDAGEIMTNPSLLEPVDYDTLNAIMEEQRTQSVNWLRDVLNGEKKTPLQLIKQNATEENYHNLLASPIDSKAVTAALDPQLCTGCSACLAACPANAITLKPDAWGYYRSAVNYEACINCGKCKQTCPALKLPENSNTKSPDCYEFISSDEEILRHSSSGGVFTTMAKEILAKGGVVVGAAWTEDLTVEHVFVSREDELYKLQKSKYLQSYMGDTFKRVKDVLTAGVPVLFSGTPCQVTGLKAYLGKDYDNLITVDIFCSNAPSAGFFKKYVEDSFPQGLSGYEFRYKKPEWNWDCLTVKATDAAQNEIVRQGSLQDNYQRAFHNHTMCSKHCENCRFQSVPRSGDITIGDFWGISRRDPKLDSKKGVSVVLINSEKGERFFLSIPDSACSMRKHVPLAWIGGNGYAINGSHSYAPASRDLFYKAIQTMPFGKAVNYALKPNHGQFRDVYAKTNSPLQFDCNMLHFHFEKNVWEETSIDGRTTLMVKDGLWREKGHFARISMAGMLQKGKQYRISCKFRITSKADVLNFHVMDSGSKQLQIIHSENIVGRNTGEQWIEFSDVFTPVADFFDEVSIGAAQITGQGNALTFAYINISEA